MPFFAGDIDFEEFESWYFNQDPKDQVRKRENTSFLALSFLLPLLQRFVDRRKVTSICQDRLGTNMTIHLTNETNDWCFGHRVLVTVFIAGADACAGDGRGSIRGLAAGKGPNRGGRPRVYQEQKGARGVDALLR